LGEVQVTQIKYSSESVKNLYEIYLDKLNEYFNIYNYSESDSEIKAKKKVADIENFILKLDQNSIMGKQISDTETMVSFYPYCITFSKHDDYILIRKILVDSRRAAITNRSQL